MGDAWQSSAQDDRQDDGRRRQSAARGGGPTDRRSGAAVKAIATMVVEMIPGGLGPWGVGDLVTAVEAVAGRTLDGLRLSVSERAIYLGASAIPVLPARPILAAYRWLMGKREPR